MKYFVAFIGMCAVIWIFLNYGLPWAFVAALVVMAIFYKWPKRAPHLKSPAPAAGGRGYPARNRDDRRPADTDWDFPMPIPPARSYEQVGDTTGLFAGIKRMQPLDGDIPERDVRPRRDADGHHHTRDDGPADSGGGDSGSDGGGD